MSDGGDAAPSGDLGRAVRVLARHGLAGLSPEPAARGHVNRVFWCGPDLVLRLAAEPASTVRLRREAALLRRLEGRLPVARLVAEGELDGYGYQLLERAAGEPLTRVWPEAGAAQKDASARTIALWLRTLRATTFPAFGRVEEPDRRWPTWRAFVTADLEADLERAAAPGGDRIEPALIAASRRWLRAHAHVLDGGPAAACLVHNDLWPDNVLAQGGVAATLLDFELALQGAADADLFKLEYFARAPADYGCEGAYDDLLPRIRRHAPDLFAVPELARRLDLYDLSFTWRNWLFACAAGAPAPADAAFTRAHLGELLGGRIRRLV